MLGIELRQMTAQRINSIVTSGECGCEERPLKSEPMMTDAELQDLPQDTSALVQSMAAQGFGPAEIHGIFVLLGLLTGIPQDKDGSAFWANVMQAMNHSPGATNLDELVGDFYEGYEGLLAELVWRTGIELTLRNCTPIEDSRPVQILYPRDNGLIASKVTKVDQLADASSLFYAFLGPLGSSTLARERSLRDSFLCGVFQSQILALSDVSGVRQLGVVLGDYLPLSLGLYKSAVTGGWVAHASKISPGQIPLQNILSGTNDEFGQQAWAILSGIFYQQETPVDGLGDLSPVEWHHRVLAVVKERDLLLPQGLLPFSASGASLSGLPAWGDEVESFEAVAAFIAQGWGFEQLDHAGPMLWDYKAVMAYTVYCSLTQSREDNLIQPA